MVSIEEAKQRIAVANSESQKLNTVRQQNIGRKETLQKQFETNLRAYNEKFGTNITVDTLAVEQERVVAEKVKEVEKVEGVINAIKAGNYELANQLSGVVKEQPSVTESATSITDSSVVNANITTPSQVGEQHIASVVDTQASAEQNVAQAFTNPVVQPAPVNVGQPAGVVQPVGVGQPEGIVQPVGVGQPAGVVQPAPNPVSMGQQMPTPQPVAPQQAQAQVQGAKPSLASLFSDDEEDSAPVQNTGASQTHDSSSLDNALSGFSSLGSSATPTPPPVSQSQPQTSFSSLLNNNQFADL